MGVLEAGVISPVDGLIARLVGKDENVPPVYAPVPDMVTD